MLTRQLAIKTAEIYTCAFTPDGARALIGSQGNPVGLWELTTGRLLRVYEHAGPAWALAWSRNQQTFLSLDGTMRLWEVETGRCLRESMASMHDASPGAPIMSKCSPPRTGFSD